MRKSCLPPTGIDDVLRDDNLKKAREKAAAFKASDEAPAPADAGFIEAACYVGAGAARKPSFDALCGTGTFYVCVAGRKPGYAFKRGARGLGSYPGGNQNIQGRCNVGVY